MDTQKKIILPGGAGLVGQNLVARLKDRGYRNIIVLDKHPTNVDILRRIQPDITVEQVDLSLSGDWTRHFEGADTVVMLQAQIGGNDYQEFVRNNITASQKILDAIKAHRVPQLVHISSSVVESVADDFYTNTKKDQEKLVLESGIPCPILRPTLMCGWFDRIISCIEHPELKGIYNISGHEKVDYIDIIREIKTATRSRTPIVRIPYGIFYALLWTWALFDRNPPFTTQQLAALSAKDEFEVIDWPGIFGVQATPFRQAIDETFNDPRYGKIVLEF